MNLYDPTTRKYRSVWRIGPSIRECCRYYGLARAAWWWEVNQRFKDLDTEGLDDRDLEEALRGARKFIEELLEQVVPKPDASDRREYREFRKMYPSRRRARPRLPAFVEILGINWPCSEADLKMVWKRLALKHHPDHGGDPQDFIRVKNAYDAAILRIQR